MSEDDDVAARIDAVVDDLLSGDLTRLSCVELLERVRHLERVRRRVYAVEARLLAEMGARHLAGEYGRASTADLLVGELHISPGEACMRVRQAQDLGPRMTVTGEPLPPLLPVSAAAVEAGDISQAHVAVIADCLDALPSSLDVDSVQVAEAALVQAARQQHPAMLRSTAALLLARLDPDGLEPREGELERRRELTLARNRDGSGRLSGRLTPEATVIWDTILDALSAPVPVEDGAHDDRSAGQRRHDGLIEAGQRLLRCGDLPAAGGIPVTVLVALPPPISPRRSCWRTGRERRRPHRPTGSTCREPAVATTVAATAARPAVQAPAAWVVVASGSPVAAICSHCIAFSQPGTSTSSRSSSTRLAQYCDWVVPAAWPAAPNASR